MVGAFADLFPASLPDFGYAITEPSQAGDLAIAFDHPLARTPHIAVPAGR
jgi:hypothetical protein